MASDLADAFAGFTDVTQARQPTRSNAGIVPVVETGSAALPAPSSPSEQAHAMSELMRRIAITDLLVIAVAVLAAQVIRFGAGDQTVGSHTLGVPAVGYSWLTTVLIVAWLCALRLHGGYNHRLVGHGPEEFKIVTGASFGLFAALAIICFVGKAPVARGYVAIALPTGLFLLLVSRWLWRKWLRHQRVHGRMAGAVLVVGDTDHLTRLISSFQSEPAAGFRVVAACCSDSVDGVIGSIPVVGAESDAAAIAQRLGVSTVACTSSWRLGASGLRRLGWALEGLDIDLVVSPGLTDVAGPRVLTRPVAGLPVLHVEAPVFSGPRLALKTLVDRLGAALLLLVFSPLLAGVAACVWVQDRGPIFFSHARIGREGRTFRMHKFRTMVTNAEDLLPGLMSSTEGGSLPCFKVARDPRVTPIGSWLRRFSLDELPQLINVLRGEMSLVGPRPQVQFEVDTYESDARRRLLVKPGMTGLWQINGRSDLSWDEAVRFDLYYVENWSVLLDFIILWRTLRAVIRTRGAY